MPTHKGKNIFSEIGSFFKENDANTAMNAIKNITAGLRLSEKRLFGEQSKCNCKLTRLQVLQILLLFPCFMVKNAYNYSSSALCGLFACKKDVFYRFLSDESLDWRKILASVSGMLWRKAQEDGTAADSPVCLIVDDTDFPKRGIQTELIGKVYSHVTHSMMLGFKALCLAITDGKTQMLLDFCLVGEKGKKGNYSLRQRQLDARFSKDHAEGSPVAKRKEEYDTSKISLVEEMVKRAIKQRVSFDYLLADGWFACAAIIKFITSRHYRCHYLGMIKMGNSKYMYKGKEYTARQLVGMLDRPKHGRKWSRQLGCYYITVDVKFAGRDVRLFFCKRGKRADWNGLITTNTKLSFAQAYKIYSMRWSIEVLFKESKQNLGLGKYQMRNFSSQIACTTITAMQYNILSLVKRFANYETIGGLFHDIVLCGQELSVTDRIWDAILELVKEIAHCFGIEDEGIFEMLVNRSEELDHFVNFYKMKSAS